MNNDQITTPKNKTKIIIIAIISTLTVAIIIALIVLLIQNNKQKTGEDEAEVIYGDNVALDAVGPIEERLRHREGYSTMLDFYYSVDNNMMLNTVNEVIKDGKLDQNVKHDKKTNCYNLVDDNRQESVNFCVTQDDGVDYIYNLRFQYSKGALNGSIAEVQGGFQHFDGKTTNDYELKTEAIEDYLAKK